MAIYSVGRRRVIVVLLLTSALLLTLDLRGSAVLDRARDAFAVAMTPVETATEVVTNPAERLWNAYREYDDLERENQALRERLDRVEGSRAAAEAALIDNRLLLALEDLPSLAGIPTETAEVVGASANNLDQIVEINKGSLDGIQVGMSVVNQAGLIGRVTVANPTSSQVMLVTDQRFTIAVGLLGGTGALADEEVPVNTTVSGLTPEELDDLTSPPDESDEVDAADADGDDAPGSGTSIPTTTTPLDVFGDEFPLPQSSDQPEFGPTTTVDETVADTTTTTLPSVADLPPAIPADGSPPQSIPTTIDPLDGTVADDVDAGPIQKEFGALQGRGDGRLPQVRFLQDNPSLSILQVGDLVSTAGGESSLAPPDIPVGRVINRVNRPGVAGPVLEIELHADLDQLNFVQVVLFKPSSEVE